MYDAITATDIPAGATLIAGYGDGYYNNVSAFKARFPHATVVEIAVFASDDLGVVLDVENGDASPAQAPGWAQMRRAAGVDPSVYCNTSTWPLVRSAFQSAGVAEPHYWVAQYDGDPTIPTGAVAKQYADQNLYDLSSVADYWPGVDPKEPNVAVLDATDLANVRAQMDAALEAHRTEEVADNLWWWQHAVSGTVPVGATPAQAAAIQSIGAAIKVLDAEPAPVPVPAPVKP
jgi:hypothetical protein